MERVIKVVILPFVLFCSITAASYYLYFTFNKTAPNPKEPTGSTDSTPSPTTKEPTEQKSLCLGLSEKECLGKLNSCVEHPSLREYFISNYIYIAYPDTAESHIERISPNLKLNIPNAKIYKLSQEFIDSNPPLKLYSYINIDNTYCAIDSENVRLLFAPINSPEDALAYYLFIRKFTRNSGSEIYITDAKQYDNPVISENTKKCPTYKELLKNKISTGTKSKSGYDLSILYFASKNQSGFIGDKVHIAKDGTITDLQNNPSLDLLIICSDGFIY